MNHDPPSFESHRTREENLQRIIVTEVFLSSTAKTPVATNSDVREHETLSKPFPMYLYLYIIYIEYTTSGPFPSECPASEPQTETPNIRECLNPTRSSLTPGLHPRPSSPRSVCTSKRKHPVKCPCGPVRRGSQPPQRYRLGGFHSLSLAHLSGQLSNFF